MHKSDHPILTKPNLALTGLIVLAHAYVLVLLPVYLLPLSAWYALTLLPFFFLHSIQWGLIHEAIHRNLHPDRQKNEQLARLLSVLFGSSFAVLSFGHLMHHRLNRDWQSELVEEKTAANTVNYYFTVLGGLYLTEIVASLVLAVMPERLALQLTGKHRLIEPAIAESAKRYFYEKDRITDLRVDTVLFCTLWGAAFVFYGSYAALLLAFLASRALMVSFMDNLYHYGTDKATPGKNLQLSRAASLLLLHSNYHGTHHRHPHIPWPHLAKAEAGFDGNFLPHALMQLKGPIAGEPANTVSHDVGGRLLPRPNA